MQVKGRAPYGILDRPIYSSITAESLTSVSPHLCSVNTQAPPFRAWLCSQTSLVMSSLPWRLSPGVRQDQPPLCNFPLCGLCNVLPRQ